MIEINGLKIETGKYYNEYTKEELAVLPQLNVDSKSHVLLDRNGQWYLDTSDWF